MSEAAYYSGYGGDGERYSAWASFKDDDGEWHELWHREQKRSDVGEKYWNMVVLDSVFIRIFLSHMLNIELKDIPDERIKKITEYRPMNWSRISRNLLTVYWEKSGQLEMFRE